MNILKLEKIWIKKCKMYKCFLKRCLDLLIAITALLILSPLLLLVCVILKFTGEKEIFYMQERMGFKNKKFKIFKFATMIKNSPNIGTKSLTLRNDPRVLPFGRILRKTKINELPQILNVLKGDMSIVGPRPQMEVDFLVYPKYVQDSIYSSKPGITGMNQIFFRDEEKNISNAENPRKYYKEKIAPSKGKLELWYLENINFFTDLKIIMITALIILFPNAKFFHKLFKNLPEK